MTHSLESILVILWQTNIAHVTFQLQQCISTNTYLVFEHEEGQEKQSHTALHQVKLPICLVPLILISLGVSTSCLLQEVFYPSISEKQNKSSKDWDRMLQKMLTEIKCLFKFSAFRLYSLSIWKLSFASYSIYVQEPMPKQNVFPIPVIFQN